MKKLMVAMTLVAGLGLAAQAAEEKIDYSANFEKRDVGAFDVNGYDDDDLDPRPLWSRVAATGSSEVKAYAAPEEGNNNYLYIDEDDVLTRNLANPTNIPQYGYIKVASKVQFTAQDADDVEPTIASGSKIALWAQVNEGVTNLMVTAGKALGDANKTNFVTNIELDKGPEGWYDLVVESKKGSNGAVFTITIDGVTVKTADEEMDAFQSLVDFTTVGFDTISSIGFKGVGAADDIVFSSDQGVAPEQPTHYAVTIDPAEAAEVMDTLTYTVDDGEPVDFDTEGFDILTNSIKSVITINAVATGYDDYEKTYSKDEFSALNGQLTITLTPSAGGDLPSFIDPEDTENAALYTAWATTYGITDPSKVKQDAFLLNCDNTDDAIAAAKKEFKIESIEIDAEGNVTVVGPDQEDYNGTVVLKGSAEVDGEYTKEAVDEKTAKFFKAYLEYIPAN